MNKLLALLMHTQSGLSLSQEDWLRLIDPHKPDNSLPMDQLSFAARSYLHAHPDWEELSLRTWDRSLAAGVKWAYPGHVDYPMLWYRMKQQPLLISFMGEPVWNKIPLVAVVGSRTPMVDTLQWMNRELGEFLRSNTCGVVSGGARGIDQWAHRLSLDNVRPTVAVFPSGILNPYPQSQEKLWHRIVREGGAVLSTFGLDQGMRKHAFHVRNRWIAGLGVFCFVAEANRRSGSALTAKLATDEDRELATLPVSPLSTQGLANLDLLSGGGAHMLRDHQDLTTLFDRSVTKWFRFENSLSPTSPECLESDQQENGIHQPQGDRSGKNAVAGCTFG